MLIYGRFLVNDLPRYAQIENDTAHFVEDIFNNPTRTGESAPVARLSRLAPIAPAKLLCIGLNYADHIKEFNREVPASPVAWLKSPQAIIGSGEPLRIVHPTHRTDCEAELCVVIKRECKNVPEEHALDYVFGYTQAQDISDRDLQKAEGQWARAKSFDTYAPVGPYIYTDLEPGNLAIECRVNGEVRQQSNTREMIFSVPFLVAHLSRGMTLLPGDAIMTGTPDGVAALRAGDELETRIGPMEPLFTPVRNADD